MTRPLMACVVAAAMFMVSAIGAQAQSRTVRVIVPFGAGGAPDTVARVLADQIAKARGVAMVVENRPGAGAIIGTEAAMRATPDGNTLLITASSFLINPHVRKVNFNPLADFEPICHLVSVPAVFAVDARSPYRTLGDLLEAARAKPGALTVGTPGPATTHHIIFESFKQQTKADMTYVPYPTTPPAITAVLGGHVTTVLSDYGSMAPQIKSGQLRPLAVASASRMAVLPDVPTTAEAGVPNVELEIWFGIVAPAKTSKQTIDELIDWYRAALKDEAAKARLLALQLNPVGQCGADFASFLGQQYKAFERIIREANIMVK